MEIQFPAVPNMATAALNELLDANRAYARDLVRSFVPRTPREKLHVVFPDVEEARLAVRAYGDVNFTVRALPKQRPLYVREGGVAIVVQPGFNVSEWMEIENLEGMPIITVNADLDKVRSSYYPRLFYPGLYKVKERFLSRFEEAYYIKMFANGGTLMRRFPDGWRLFYAALDGLKEVWSGQSRPEPRMVERLLAECRRKEYI